MNYEFLSASRRLFYRAFLNSVSLTCKVLSEKYCPERSGGAEIFSQTRRALATLLDKSDTELPLAKI